MLHLSSLLIILVFGLIMSNRNIFFPGKLRRFLDEGHMAAIFDNFKMITLESSFIVRTFFFVIFGFTILLTSLLDLKVWMVSILILGILFLFCYSSIYAFLNIALPVYPTYLQMAAAAVDRYRIIDASRSLDMVQQQLVEALAQITP